MTTRFIICSNAFDSIDDAEEFIFGRIKGRSLQDLVRELVQWLLCDPDSHDGGADDTVVEKSIMDSDSLTVFIAKALCEMRDAAEYLERSVCTQSGVVCVDFVEEVE